MDVCHLLFLCSKRNHARGSSKHARICLVCKMRSGREKRAIGKIELASSWSWIRFNISVHVNYHIVRLTRMWYFGMITYVLPECTGGSNVWVLATHDKRRTWVQDCWRRLLRKEKEYLPRDSYCSWSTSADTTVYERLYQAWVFAKP